MSSFAYFAYFAVQAFLVATIEPVSNCKNGLVARPHPGLLPRGEGVVVSASVARPALGSCRGSFSNPNPKAR